MSGYIRLHRKIHNNALLGVNPMARFVFMEMLLEAAWKDTTLDVRGRAIDIKRGQLLVSRSRLSKITGLSEQNIRTIVRALTNHKVIKTHQEHSTGPTIVSICNYDAYQSDAPSANQAANQEPTKTQPTIKEREEIEEKKAVVGRRAPLFEQGELPTDMDPDLEQIRQAWNAYAKDTGKPQVRKLTKDRRDRIRQIMEDNGYTLDDFAEAMEKASQSNYLVEEGWFTFDWMFKEDSNLSKVLEGNYGNGRHAEQDFMHGMSVKEYQQFVLNGGR